MSTPGSSLAEELENDAGRARREPPLALLAEDDPELRYLLARTLRGEGYQVLVAADGAELMGHLMASKIYGGERPSPDLIVSDIRMPGYSGIEVLATLRRLFWRLPMLLITAFGDEETHLQARELGAAAVLDKPFSMQDFRRTLASCQPPR